MRFFYTQDNNGWYFSRWIVIQLNSALKRLNLISKTLIQFVKGFVRYGEFIVNITKEHTFFDRGDMLYAYPWARCGTSKMLRLPELKTPGLPCPKEDPTRKSENPVIEMCDTHKITNRRLKVSEKHRPCQFHVFNKSVFFRLRLGDYWLEFVHLVQVT